MTYCFRCRNCGETTQSSYRSLPHIPCQNCGEEELIRDYRAEAAGIGQGVRVYEKGVHDARAFHTWAESGGE